LTSEVRRYGTETGGRKGALMFS